MVSEEKNEVYLYTPQSQQTPHSQIGQYEDQQQIESEEEEVVTPKPMI